MVQEPLFEVWRRPRLTRESWHKVPGLKPLPHDAAFQAAVAFEKKASWVDWEYALAPVGQTPASRREQARGAFYDGYRTKQMRPR